MGSRRHVANLFVVYRNRQDFMTPENARWDQVSRERAWLNVVEIGEREVRRRGEHPIRRGLVDESERDDRILQCEARGERMLKGALETGRRHDRLTTERFAECLENSRRPIVRRRSHYDALALVD